MFPRTTAPHLCWKPIKPQGLLPAGEFGNTLAQQDLCKNSLTGTVLVQIVYMNFLGRSSIGLTIDEKSILALSGWKHEGWLEAVKHLVLQRILPFPSFPFHV